jgi:hypothetical protein
MFVTYSFERKKPLITVTRVAPLFKRAIQCAFPGGSEGRPRSPIVERLDERVGGGKLRRVLGALEKAMHDFLFGDTGRELGYPMRNSRRFALPVEETVIRRLSESRRVLDGAYDPRHHVAVSGPPQDVDPVTEPSTVRLTSEEIGVKRYYVGRLTADQRLLPSQLAFSEVAHRSVICLHDTRHEAGSTRGPDFARWPAVHHSLG